MSLPPYDKTQNTLEGNYQPRQLTTDEMNKIIEILSIQTNTLDVNIELVHNYLNDLNTSGSWNDLTDKPSTFPPEAHSHSEFTTIDTDITNLENDVDQINQILHTDDESLDTFVEIIEFIKNNDTSITNHIENDSIHQSRQISIEQPSPYNELSIWLQDLADPTKPYTFINIDKLFIGASESITSYNFPLTFTDEVTYLNNVTPIEPVYSDAIILDNLFVGATTSDITVDLVFVDSITDTQLS